MVDGGWWIWDGGYDETIRYAYIYYIIIYNNI